MIWDGIGDIHDLNWQQAKDIELYTNDIFRSTMFAMSLTVGIMAVVAQSHRRLVLRLCMFFVTITALYSMYVVITVHLLMRSCKMYSRWTPTYYLTAVVTMFFLAVIIFVYGSE